MLPKQSFSPLLRIWKPMQPQHQIGQHFLSLNVVRIILGYVLQLLVCANVVVTTDKNFGESDVRRWGFGIQLYGAAIFQDGFVDLPFRNPMIGLLEVTCRLLLRAGTAVKSGHPNDQENRAQTKMRQTECSLSFKENG